MEITLYYAPIACSLVPYVTLTEANANFSVQTINLQKGQQRNLDPTTLGSTPSTRCHCFWLTENLLPRTSLSRYGLRIIFRKQHYCRATRGIDSERFRSFLVRFEHSSFAVSHQFSASGLRCPKHRRQRSQAGCGAII